MARFWPWAAFALVACGRPAPISGPLVLRDDAGHLSTLPRAATRVVSLAPSTTELLFALGGGSVLVGRTRWCDYPPSAALVPSVGDGLQPNVEAILARAPDLVVAYRSVGNRAAIDRLRELGIPTIEVATDRLADLDRAARLLATAIGRPTAGDSLIAALASGVAEATVRRDHVPSVFVLSWAQPVITVGAGSFLSEIIERAGGRNVFADEARPSFVVSLEAVVARNPDFVLLSGNEEPAFASRPEWQVLPAVRERRFLRVDGSEFNRPSPRAPQAIARLASLLAER